MNGTLTSTKLMNAYPTLWLLLDTSILGCSMGLDSLAVVCEIDAQIHKIILSPAGFVDDPLQHGLVNLVGYVAKHDLHEAVSYNTNMPGRSKGSYTVVRTSIPSRIRATSTWL